MDVYFSSSEVGHVKLNDIISCTLTLSSFELITFRSGGHIGIGIFRVVYILLILYIKK